MTLRGAGRGRNQDGAQLARRTSDLTRMTDEDTWPELGILERGFDKALGECFDTTLPCDLAVTVAVTAVGFGVLPTGGGWLLVGFGLVLPYALRRGTPLLMRAHAHRGDPFEFTGRWWTFFRVAGAALVAVGLSADMVLGQLHHYLRPFSDEHAGWVKAAYWALCGSCFVSVEAATRNALVNHTRCGSVRFESRLETGRLLWLYVTGFGAMVLSFGLLVPWAELRLRRYRRSSVHVVERSAKPLTRSCERELRSEAEEHAGAITSRQESVEAHERQIEPSRGHEVEP